MINLRDGSWASIFPAVFKLYREVKRQRDIAKIKILEVHPESVHIILMEVAREEGRVYVGFGVETVIPSAELERIIEISNAIEKDD